LRYCGEAGDYCGKMLRRFRCCGDSTSRRRELHRAFMFDVAAIQVHTLRAAGMFYMLFGRISSTAVALSDAASRGKYALVAELCAQHGVNARRLEIPTATTLRG
jgi:hypothetical protein